MINGNVSFTQNDSKITKRVTELPARGKLIKPGILGFDSPKDWYENLKEDVINLKAGLKGKGNDYQLGKNNDFAMKLGSAALAAYLFIKNPLKLRAGMEFFGAGAFFASMALWPKLFIRLPLKMQTGVDVQQKYRDSFGRTKNFFQDPQYLPWDLYSKEELAQMGDKMGIPKNIPNREELIKDRAQKVAIQANTLWMLTAGFATPLMTALICNYSEPWLGKFLENRAVAKTQSGLDGIASVATDAATEKEVAAYINDNASVRLNTNVVNDIALKISGGDIDIKDGIVEEIQSIAEKKHQSGNITPKFLSQIYEESIGSKISDYTGEFGNDFVKCIEEAKSSEGGIRSGIEQWIKNTGHENMINVEEIVAEIEKLNQNKNGITISDIEKELKEISKAVESLRAKLKVIREYTLQRVGEKAETSIANSCINFSDKFLKILGIKDLDRCATDKDYAMKSVNAALEELAKPGNEKKFEKALNLLAEEAERFDALTSEDAGKKLGEIIDKVCKDEAESLNAKGYTKIVKKLVGNMKDGLDKDIPGSRKATLKKSAENAALGAKATFARAMLLLDTYKRFADKSYEKVFNFITGGETEELRKANENIANIWRKLDTNQVSNEEINKLNEFFADLFKNSGEAIPEWIKNDKGIYELKNGYFADSSYEKVFNFITGGETEELRKANENIANIWQKLNAKNQVSNEEINKLNEFFTDLFRNSGEAKPEWIKNDKGLYELKNGNARLTALMSLREKYAQNGINEEEAYKEFVNNLKTWRKLEAKNQVSNEEINKLNEFFTDLFRNSGEAKPEWVKNDKGIYELKNGNARLTALKSQREAYAKSGVNPEAYKEFVKNVKKQCIDVLLSNNANDYLQKFPSTKPSEYFAVNGVLFGDDLSASTGKTLSQKAKSLISKFKNLMFDIGSSYDWINPKKQFTGGNGGGLTLTNHLSTGNAPLDMVRETAQRAANTSKWLKIFGGMFAGLVTVTLVAERFFGKERGNRNV